MIVKSALLCTAIAAGLSLLTVAERSEAVMLNTRGTGQVLIYPYYTVNGGHQTLLSVVNTSSSGKALRVRFHEGRNGREALQFNLYLSEYDVWTAAVFELPAAPGVDAPANLTTTDLSCTVPAIRTSTTLPQLPNNGPRYVAFRNFAYSGANADVGPTNLARTREGYVEIIEMGALVDNSASDRAITHSQTTFIPSNCPSVVAAWAPADGYWTQNANTDMVAPSGGLFGAGLMVDVAEGIALGYAAEAIEDFRVQTLHTEPSATRPNLADALTDVANDLAVAYVPVNGKSARSEYRASTHGIDAVSAVLMADEVLNEYNTQLILGATGEWVVTFPTRRFYTDPAITGVPTGFPPFLGRSAGSGISFPLCSDFYPYAFNREETIPGGPWIFGFGFSPQPLPTFCFASSILTLSQPIAGGTTGPSRILGSMLVTQNLNLATLQFQVGWMRIALLSPLGLDTPMRASIDGDVYTGLPAVGFALTNFINSNAQPGRLANYSTLTPHRMITRCQSNVTASRACE